MGITRSTSSTFSTCSFTTYAELLIHRFRFTRPALGDVTSALVNTTTDTGVEFKRQKVMTWPTERPGLGSGPGPGSAAHHGLAPG